MRLVLLVVICVLATACGRSEVVHYRVQPALECLRQTNSAMLGIGPVSITMVFTSDDGVSAIEPVFVTFGSTKISGPGAAALGLTRREPVWKEQRGDARVSGYGPYEPPIAHERGITKAQAEAAADELGPAVRTAIDDCLQKNERR